MELSYSPWGEVQTCKELVKGIYEVTTASHGGIMVAQESLLYLSPEARKCGFRDGSYLCFEEDADAQVVQRDLLDSGVWKIPKNYCKDPVQYEAAVNRVVQSWHPEYWKAREARSQSSVRQAPRPRTQAAVR